MSVPVSQFISHTPSPLGVHTFVLYVCLYFCSSLHPSLLKGTLNWSPTLKFALLTFALLFSELFDYKDRVSVILESH